MIDLLRYDREIGFHLKEIEYLANRCRHHVIKLRERPAFETKAEDELHQLECELASALDAVRTSRASLKEKPSHEIGSQCAGASTGEAADPPAFRR